MNELSPNIWYDPSSTLSHNCIINMVLSMRGGGKTYNTLKMCVNRWIKYKRQFIYLRRTEAELDECKDKLFNAHISQNEFPNKSFKIIGNELFCNDEVMGYCVALSTTYKVKSVAYPLVDYIVFDEFLIEDTKKSQYLSREVEKLMSLIETVGRLRPIKVMLLANYISKSNIYFDHWKIHPKKGSIFTKHPSLPVLIHMYTNQAFIDEKAKTPFAKLIQGTLYGDYLLNNNALMDNSTFIETLTDPCKYLYSIKFNGLHMGVWINENKGLLYISSKIDPNNREIYAFDTESHEPNILLLKTNRTNPIIKRLKFAIENAVCRYENMSIKNSIYEMLNYL